MALLPCLLAAALLLTEEPPLLNESDPTHLSVELSGDPHAPPLHEFLRCERGAHRSQWRCLHYRGDQPLDPRDPRLNQAAHWAPLPQPAQAALRKAHRRARALDDAVGGGPHAGFALLSARSAEGAHLVRFALPIQVPSEPGPHAQVLAALRAAVTAANPPRLGPPSDAAPAQDEDPASSSTGPAVNSPAPGTCSAAALHPSPQGALGSSLLGGCASDYSSL